MNIKELRTKYGESFFSVVEDELRRLAKANPNFRYSTQCGVYCKYNGPAMKINKQQAGPDCKGCVFGQALQNLGWDDEDELDLSVPIHVLIEGCPRSWADIQKYQDIGHTWKEAVSWIES